MASWSCSGMPSSMPITRMGIWAPRSAMKSNPPLPTSGSRLRAQNSRTWPSRASIFLGVNTRDITLRWMSWMGGSSKRTMPGGISMPALMSSRMEPLPDRYVSQSTRPFSTSSKRLSAQKSCLSLYQSGASSRIRRQTEYGSTSISVSYGS